MAEDKVVTTNEELEAFQIVKAILREKISSACIVLKKVYSFYLILILICSFFIVL